jgi:hypothetical protein
MSEHVLNTLPESVVNSVKNKLSEFKNSPEKIKQALGATTGAVVLFAGLYGLQTVLKKKPKPAIKYLSPAISHYLQYNEDWYYLIVSMSDYGHFAVATFERLAEAVTHLIYLTADLETHQQHSKLYLVAQLIGIIVECIRVIRAHLSKQYVQVEQVMLEFDEIAANMQQICTDTQYNVDNVIAYQRMTKK